MNPTLFYFLAQLSSFAGLGPLVVGLARKSRLDPVQNRLLTLVVVLFCTEMLVNWLWLNGRNNNPVFHFYVILEFILTVRTIKLAVKKEACNYLIVIEIAFVLFSVYNTLFLQDLMAFNSYASNLVAGDTNEMWDTFVHDRQTGETTRISLASDGAQANSSSGHASISADGSYLAFVSTASNLITGDTNGMPDIFTHDRLSGDTLARSGLAHDGEGAPLTDRKRRAGDGLDHPVLGGE